MVNFVKQKDISPASYVYYNYRAASFNDRDTTGRQRYQYGIHVEREDLASVDDATDLRGYFKVLAQ